MASFGAFVCFTGFLAYCIKWLAAPPKKSLEFHDLGLCVPPICLRASVIFAQLNQPCSNFEGRIVVEIFVMRSLYPTAAHQIVTNRVAWLYKIHTHRIQFLSVLNFILVSLSVLNFILNLFVLRARNCFVTFPGTPDQYACYTLWCMLQLLLL